jgi:hypothetical protein
MDSINIPSGIKESSPGRQGKGKEILLQSRQGLKKVAQDASPGERGKVFIISHFVTIE